MKPLMLFTVLCLFAIKTLAQQPAFEVRFSEPLAVFVFAGNLS